jgi:hypothetical protein
MQRCGPDGEMTPSKLADDARARRELFQWNGRITADAMCDWLAHIPWPLPL